MILRNKIEKYINQKTVKYNRDNISRTLAYELYYRAVPDIQWAYLASMVSRNAGWSMCDLKSRPVKQLVSDETGSRLFTTYERANWLIFSDAYPQLLIYKLSVSLQKPLFYLLEKWHTARWMIEEWEVFWREGDKKRLLNALIINEQHVIQNPVIEAPFFYKKVFKRALYEWQERLHMSVVLFPGLSGELYGHSVTDFTCVRKRIKLGKQLAWILFCSPENYDIRRYFECSVVTGNRRLDIPLLHKSESGLPLRMLYGEVYHRDESRKDWSVQWNEAGRLLHKHTKPPAKYRLTDWYRHKNVQISTAADIAETVKQGLKAAAH